VTSTDLDDPAEAQAPPVVVALVTHGEAPWLEGALASLAAQDYPNLSVLVLATGEGDDVLRRVAAVLPGAFVRRIEGNPGFGPAANDVLEVVEGAAFYAFCHDDVVLDPTAIRALVEEAFRSNAGITGPKLVEWQAPERLQHVGMSVDKGGVRAALVERGELDQEQHDAVRDVFLIPGACTLVRADLFATIGGFDPAIHLLGEDLDLCWRAQVAGARVVIVPAARVQHRESLADRAPERAGELATRHRIRTVLTSYGRFHLVRVVPQLLLLGLMEIVHGIAGGRRQKAKDVVAAWRWNLGRLPEIRERRRALRAVRQFPDSEVRRLQQPGSVQVRTFLRSDLSASRRLRASFLDLGHDLEETMAVGSGRMVLAVWAALLAVLAIGSRDLLFDRIPAVAGLVPFDDSPFHLLSRYLSGWRYAGLGGEAPQPTALGLLGLAGIPFLGGMGLLQQVLVLGALPAGAVGAWRLTRPLGSRVGRVAGLVAYAAVPLPYDALERGSWGGVLVYAAAPWIVSRLIAAAGDLPAAFGPPIRRRDRRAVVGLGILVALLAAFVPLVVVLVPVVALALVAGAALTGTAQRAAGALGVAAGAALVALVVHVPWTFDFFLPGSDWWSTAGVSPLVHHTVSVGALLRFDTGDGGIPALGWALPVAAALPLVIGREWRFVWAVRCWLVALTCWAVAWFGGQGALGVDLPPADVVLSFGAAALAFSVALGVIAFERDLRGYHFGWRQIASLVAGAALLIGTLPVLVGAIDGRWGMPASDHAGTMDFLRAPDVRSRGPFRVLWLGDPAILPLASFRLTEGIGYGVSADGAGSLEERWASPAYGGTELVADALRAAATGGTDRLGRALGVLGIRYVVLADRAAPAREGTTHRPLPAGLTATVARQLDLRRIDIDPATDLYENTAWVPVRAQVPDDADLSGSPLRAPDLAGSSRAVPVEGRFPAGTVYLAQSSSSGWSLEVDGEGAERSRAFGWANAFDVADAGEGELRYRTSPLRWLAVLLQVVLWAVAIAFATGRLPRERRR
jgi:GT2 family glycosyltransferase